MPNWFVTEAILQGEVPQRKEKDPWNGISLAIKAWKG